MTTFAAFRFYSDPSCSTLAFIQYIPDLPGLPCQPDAGCSQFANAASDVAMWSTMQSCLPDVSDHAASNFGNSPYFVGEQFTDNSCAGDRNSILAAAMNACLPNALTFGMDYAQISYDTDSQQVFVNSYSDQSCQSINTPLNSRFFLADGTCIVGLFDGYSSVHVFNTASNDLPATTAIGTDGTAIDSSATTTTDSSVGNLGQATVLPTTTGHVASPTAALTPTGTTKTSGSDTTAKFSSLVLLTALIAGAMF